MSDAPVDRLELAVVLPVYNEEGIIGQVLNQWLQKLDEMGIRFQIHAYDDGSTDDSIQILLKKEKLDRRLVVHRKANSGHGPTILQGYRENFKTEWILQIDSDGEIGTEAFESLWRNRMGYDLLIGKRVRAERPAARRILNRLSHMIVAILYGNRIVDVNSPCRLIKTDVFKNIFGSIPEDTFAPNLLISGIASLHKLHCFEVAVKHRKRTTGEASIRGWKMIRIAFKCCTQTIRYRFMKNAWRR